MEQITEQLTQIISKEFKLDIRPVITIPDPKFGDFATNVALQLAGQLGKSPREIAETITKQLLSDPALSTVEIAGPGFINIKLADQPLIDELALITKDPSVYGKSDKYAGQVVVTEYSDPNPFKVLHVGHLYTSIVGDAISNLVEQAGGTVHRVNFGGDVGLHVGKTMWGIVREFGGENPEKLAEIPEAERSEWMARCYVEGTRAYEDDEAAKSQIIDYNKQVYQLHTDDIHDTPFAQIYWTCRTWSYDYFDAFYARIGTKFEKYYPESSVAPVGLSTVLAQKDRGVYKESKGAIIFDGEPFGVHTRVFVNSNGLPTYEAKDVGLAVTKWSDYHFDSSIIITGNDILDYMKTVLTSIRQFLPEPADRTQHFTHGNVKLAGGVKMSSRKGNFLRAVDVLDITAEANQAAQGASDPAVVLGAVKYAFLKVSVGPDIIFEPENSVSLQGNSGPYLQYSHARAKSILKTIKKVGGQEVTTLDQHERALVFKLIEFKSIVATATDHLAPHLICGYLYELAQTFNRFYENDRVAGDPRESFRAQLIATYAAILARGLSILGIQSPDHM